jgi:hypothetical protein
VISLLKLVFGTMVGVELANYDMANQAVRNLDRNRRRLAKRLERIPPYRIEAEELRYHLQQIDNELTRLAYYGFTPPNRAGPHPLNSIYHFLVDLCGICDVTLCICSVITILRNVKQLTIS